jgi:1-acyl-sn-glycerol-3-phosphate acyltransferase
MNSSIEISEHFIDIEQLFARKNPRLLKILPKFIFSWLKKITHQDEINDYIYRHRDKSGLDFIDAMLDEFGIKSEIMIHDQATPANLTTLATLTDLLSPTGRYIIAANHPLGGMDGMALMQAAGKFRKDIVFPVNDLLTFIPGLQPLFIPINKHGKNNENIKIIENTFASGKTILYFPAGLVSRKQKGGVIKDLEWKKTFITKARKYARDIIPVYITGRNSNFFYNLAKWRTVMGIKANIEMLFLTDEMFRQKGNTIKIIFGKPIPFNTLDRSKTDAQWAEFVREKVYALSEWFVIRFSHFDYVSAI